jgi:hypothetical protein
MLTVQEIQALPFQHIVKWLPSKLRSKDPGPDDCLDVQVETTAGKKDLRMRCADVPTVQRIITDIRTTVQVCAVLLSTHQRAAPAAGETSLFSLACCNMLALCVGLCIKMPSKVGGLQLQDRE